MPDSWSSYALYRRGKLYYVSLASNLRSRLIPFNSVNSPVPGGAGEWGESKVESSCHVATIFYRGTESRE